MFHTPCCLPAGLVVYMWVWTTVVTLASGTQLVKRRFYSSAWVMGKVLLK